MGWLFVVALLLSAVTRGEVDEGTTEVEALGGNGLCWYNAEGRTYQRCCVEKDSDCWKGLGWTADVCCYPLTPVHAQCFDDMEQRLETKLKLLNREILDAFAAGDEITVRNYNILIAGFEAQLNRPLSLWAFACSALDSPLLWSEDCICCEPVVDERACHLQMKLLGMVDDSKLHPEHIRCCYPVYSRLNQQAVDKDLEASIRAVFDKLPTTSRSLVVSKGPSLQWSLGQDSYGVHNIAKGCVIRITAGGDVEACKESHACKGFDCSYLRALLLTLEIIQKTNPLPVMEFVMSAGDEIPEEYGDIPVFGRGGSRWTTTVALPHEWQLHPAQCTKHIKQPMISKGRARWEKMEPVLIWRGSHSNLWSQHCSPTRASEDPEMMKQCMVERRALWNHSTWMQMPRGRLVWISHMYSSLIDARFVKESTVLPMDPSLEEFFEDSNMFGERMTIEEQSYYKYHIAVEGCYSADRLVWQLFTGAVVIIPDGPWQLSSGLDMLKPFVHYVPVRYDLTDLIQQVKWLRAHDAEAKRIAENAVAFAHKYLTCDSNLHYVDRLLRAYAERLQP